MPLPPVWVHRPSIPAFLPLASYHPAQHLAPSGPQLEPLPPAPVPVSLLDGHPAPFLFPQWKVWSLAPGPAARRVGRHSSTARAPPRTAPPWRTAPDLGWTGHHGWPWRLLGECRA